MCNIKIHWSSYVNNQELKSIKKNQTNETLFYAYHTFSKLIKLC